MNQQKISKIGLLCIQDKKILVVFKPKIGLYITPGGKIEPQETDTECLEREVQEEIGCSVGNFVYFGTFNGITPEGFLHQKCYFGNLEGKITLNPSDTIEGYSWIDRNSADNIPLGPMLKKQIIPALIKQGYL